MTSESPADGHKVALLGRCYGPQALRIQVNGDAVGSIACDNQQHQIDVPAGTLHGHQIMIQVATSDFSSWQVEYGTAS